MKGVDIRKTGSGNPGATNVWRSAGKTAGIITLAVDVLKGFGPVFVLKQAGAPDVALAVSSLALVAGHVWTVWLGFRGGKGVATGTGVLLAITPYALLSGFCVFALVFVLTRQISAGSISGTAAAALFAWFGPGSSLFIKALMTVLCVLIIVRHRSNITRLIAGTEPKLKI